MKNLFIALTLLTSTVNTVFTNLYAEEDSSAKKLPSPAISSDLSHDAQLAEFKKRMALLSPELRQCLTLLGELSQKADKEAKKLDKRLDSMEENYNNVNKGIPYVRTAAYLGLGVATISAFLLAAKGFDKKTFFNDVESAALKVIGVAVPLIGMGAMYIQSRIQTVKFDKDTIEKSKVNAKNLKKYMGQLGQVSLMSILSTTPGNNSEDNAGKDKESPVVNK